MLCQRCKKNKSDIDFVEDVGGMRLEVHLCAPCYADMFSGLNPTPEFDELLKGARKPAQKTCPVCGTTIEDYNRTGLLGCASCYDVFKKELYPVIERIQGKVRHVGASSANNDALGLHRQLKNLQEQLEKALKERRFEEAGVLNRKIDKINKALFKGEDDD